MIEERFHTKIYKHISFITPKTTQTTFFFYIFIVQKVQNIITFGLDLVSKILIELAEKYIYSISIELCANIIFVVSAYEHFIIIKRVIRWDFFSLRCIALLRHYSIHRG